jgi:hypothetical protein
MRIVTALLAVITATLVAHPAAAGGGDSTMESIVWAEWVGDDEVSSIDAYSMVVLKSNTRRSVEYEVTRWTYIPLGYYRVPDGDGGKKDVVVYNFRGPINWLLWAAASRLAGGDSRGDTMASPWCYALFAPNSLVRFRLIGNLKLVLGTRTDYILYDTESTEAGIMFTPQVGLDFSGGTFGDTNSYSGISGSVGVRSRWGLDGDSDSGELVFVARVWGIPFTR